MVDSQASQDRRIYQGILQPNGFFPLPETWESEWETYAANEGGPQIFAVTHRRKDGHLGHRALVISHGIGEHGGRYLHFPHYLDGTIGTLFCPDHQGHGRSEGLRGHIANFKDFSEDLALGIRRLDEVLRRRYGRSEIHLLGHSMGSLIALHAAFTHPNLPLRSVTMSSPLLGVKVEAPRYKTAAAGVMSKLWGHLQMDTGLDASLLSRDPEVVRTYLADRLVHGKITPKLYTGMMSLIASTTKRDSGLNYPLMMVVPMEDRITDAEAAIAYFNRLQSREKRLKTLPGYFHESFNEPGKELAFEELKEWITQHSDAV